MKKLIPAIVMLLVSAVVLSTASYAWFTTSTAVSADGMQVTATAPSSILIRGKADATNWTAYSNVLNFGDIYASTKLTPASSANGVNFYAPANAYDAAGAMDYMTDISAVSGPNTYYVDFQVDLKNDSVNHIVDIGVQNITNSLTNSAMKNALRVAIIVGTPRAQDAELPADPVASTTNTTVYTVTGYTEDWVNVASKGTNDNLVYTTPAEGPIESAIAVDEDTTYDAWKTVAIGDTDWAATAYDTVIIEDLQPQQSVQVTIRVWFEGQDAACVSANAGASANLSVQFGIIGTPEEVTTVAP